MDIFDVDPSCAALAKSKITTTARSFSATVDDLPDELLSSVFAELPVTADQHLVLCCVNRRFCAVACSTYFCAQVSGTRYRELCRLFQNAAWIMTPKVLIDFASIDINIKDATEFLCQKDPTIQKEKVRQGLYILDAMHILCSLSPAKEVQSSLFDRNYHYEDIVRRVVSGAYIEHIYEAIPYLVKHGDTGWMRHLKSLLVDRPPQEFGRAVVFAIYNARPALKIAVSNIPLKNLVRLYRIGEDVSRYLVMFCENGEVASLP